jgi:thiol-disulfide isomerase/thioredoxin
MRNRSVKNLICAISVLAIAASLGSAALAQAAGTFDKETALRELDALVHGKAIALDWTSESRAGRLDEWAERVKESNLDLGEDAFALYIPRYESGEAQERLAASDDLADFIIEHGGLPSKTAEVFSDSIGGMMTMAVIGCINKGDFITLQKILPTASIYFSNVSGFYTSFGGRIRLKGGDDAAGALVTLMTLALNDVRLDAETKNNILKSVYGGSGSRTASGAPAPRTAAPSAFISVKGANLDGKEVSAADYKGKVVLIDFWATWCGPCMKEMPSVVAAHEKYKGQGFEILGVSLDAADQQDKIRQVMKANGMTWEQIYDGGGWKAKNAVQNNVNSIPMTFLLDRSGAVRHKGLRGEELMSAIEELLKEKAPAAPSARGAGR